MKKTWNKTIIMVVISSVLAILVSSNVPSKREQRIRDQYDEKRLQNDSLMGEIQTLQKQLWEKEKNVQAKENLIDSLTCTCTNTGTNGIYE